MSAGKKDHLSEKGVAPVFLASPRGISQVFFIENAVTGVVILIAVMVSSWSWGVITLLSSIIGTLIGKIGGVSANNIKNGLYGYNTILSFMAVAVVFRTEENRFQFISGIIAACVAILLTASIFTWNNYWLQ